jgi:phenylacetate-coenzyme A ligase PaaK-like adenylate-forming protein
MMARFEDWVTDPTLDLAALRRHAERSGGSGPAFDERYLVWESSGSSGAPALFVQDALALAVYDAIEAARGPIVLPGRDGLPPLWHSDARLALVGAIDGPFASIVSLQRLRRINPWMAQTARPFSFLQPIDDLVAALNDWAPSVVATYPSMAWVLAQEQAAGRLRLDLQAVWTGGETLTPATRAAIAAAFAAPVRDSYGSSECLSIAHECPHGALHLNADWVILEPVDEHLRPVPPGVRSFTTLLTNLSNRVQPIVRYDLGDSVRLRPEPCACGRTHPVLEVEGRCDDLLSLESASGRPVHLAPLALTTVLEEDAGVFDFRLCAASAQALRLELYGGVKRDDGRRAARVLEAWLGRQGVGSPHVDTLHRRHAAARGRTGKWRRIVGSRATPA